VNPFLNIKTLLSGIALAALFFFCAACGVKLAPIAPKATPEIAHPILVCTPKNEECEIRDEEYVPRGPPYEDLPNK
jgi:hypothetical protein